MSMDNIWRFTKEQYDRFKGSKYYGMMYKDKMTLKVVLQKGNDIFVKAGEGMDYKFYEDIFNPFIHGDGT